MKTQKQHLWLSIILMLVLLCQWSFASYHVFTSHSFHSENKVDNSHEAVFGSDLDCELCAKLNTKPAPLLFVPKIAFISAIGYEVILWEYNMVFTSLVCLNLQRGPPVI